MPTDDLTEDESAHLREMRDNLRTATPESPLPKVTVEFVPWEPTAEELRHAAPLWPERFTEEHLRALQAKNADRWTQQYPGVPPPKRYIPDLSEVPPDPADPVPVGHPGAGWRPFRCVPEYVEAEPEPAPPPRRYNYISVQAPRGPNDPCVISAAGREAKALPPLTDAEIEAALEPLRRDIEEAGGRLEVRYEEPVPPWPERDALIAREQAAVFERLAEPRGALTYPDAGRVWLPKSPVVQAALVVEQGPHALRSGSWIDFDPGTVGKADFTRVTTWRAEPDPNHPGKARYTLLDVRDADPEE